MRIGIICVGYDDFDFEAFYDNMESNFLPSHLKHYYLFTNKTERIYKNNISVYYSLKELGLYANFRDVMNDVLHDNMELLFFSGLNIRVNLQNGTQFIPNENELYTSLDEKDAEVYLFNFKALVDHIKGREGKCIYGSYLPNFFKLIKYFDDNLV